MTERTSATDEPNDSTALTVTFDTNTLNSVIWPENQQCENPEDAITVRAAIQDGRIRGFFSETLYTLEGIVSYERAEILGKTRVEVGALSAFSVGSHHERNPLNPLVLLCHKVQLCVIIVRVTSTFFALHFPALLALSREA